MVVDAVDVQRIGLRELPVAPHDHQILVTCTLTHPAFTTPDGQKHTQEVYEVFQVDPGKSVPEECMWYFVKECPYEFVPGKWSITFDIDGKTVLTKDFHIYKPKPATAQHWVSDQPFAASGLMRFLMMPP